ncbi:MAG: bifunctional riboflavin kinase/FAD synthetase [Oscillospiraceae bacterium]|nr:bifunctional riboflavin kinase/FAD synthetase [Oscillospiraceae bacterium]
MEREKRNVIALGFFDGIHRGHQALLKTAVERAEQLGMEPAVFTFDRSPKEFVSGVPVPLITSAEERCNVVHRLFPIQNVHVIVVPFDEEMMTMPWVDFVLMLAQKYHAGWLVAGHDFRFGYKNAGTPALLCKKAAQLGMGCDIIPAVTLDGVTVSSTHIRSLLLQGEMEQASYFLGYDYTMTGKVLHGKGLGRKIGAPTLNLVPTEHQLIPAYGVYATRVSVNGRTYPAVTNVGVRPTVDTAGGVTVESHLLDINAQLYGSECRVEFLKLMRRETKFDNLDALQAQIAKDIADVKAYFEHRETAAK